LLIRKKNDNEEEEERVGEGVCHKGCHPHWHSTFRCGKPGSTYIGRAPTWEAHLAESRCGNCFSKSVVVKIISQKGQNKISSIVHLLPSVINSFCHQCRSRTVVLGTDYSNCPTMIAGYNTYVTCKLVKKKNSKRRLVR
jgi:hypothetical protein